MPQYDKLVRDRIPDIIRAEGKKVRLRVLDEAEFRVALVEKILEESRELAEACGTGEVREIMKETADVLETLEALLTSYGIESKNVELLKALRREGRGGFDGRIFLESSDD